MAQCQNAQHVSKAACTTERARCLGVLLHARGSCMFAGHMHLHSRQLAVLLRHKASKLQGLLDHTWRACTIALHVNVK